MTLEEQIKLHEGLRLKPYRDTTGHLTIGHGRNLSTVGISEAEALILLRNDIQQATHDLVTALPWVANLSEVRRNVLIDMTFNLGILGLLRFKKTLTAIQAGNYEQAAEQMLASKWAEQVKGRAKRLAEMMKTGQA